MEKRCHRRHLEERSPGLGVGGERGRKGGWEGGAGVLFWLLSVGCYSYSGLDRGILRGGEMRGDENDSDNVRIGEIVWARVSGHPWWPATISRNMQKKTWKKQGKVWVNFFNDNQGAWIPVKSHLRPLDDKSTETCMVKPTHRSFRMIKEALTEASEVLAKQKADGMEVAVVDTEEILALAEKQAKEAEEKKSSSTSKERGKRSLSVTADVDAKRRRINDEIVPAEEENDDQPKGRTRRRSRQPPRASSMGSATRKRVVSDDRTETSEEMEIDPPPMPEEPKRIPDKVTRKVEALEAETTKLKAELKRLKDELKDRKALPKKEVVHVAAVPSTVTALEFEIVEERGVEKCEKEALQELLKSLKQHSHTFEEQSDLVADHKKVCYPAKILAKLEKKCPFPGRVFPDECTVSAPFVFAAITLPPLLSSSDQFLNQKAFTLQLQARTSS